MSTQPDIPESLDPFGAWRAARDISQETWRATRDISLETLSRLMIDLVNSEAYSQATSQWLDTYLTLSQPFQRVLQTTMTQILSGLNMPLRADVTSLAERLTNVEMRLDDMDARLDVILHAVQSLAASKQPAEETGRAPDLSSADTGTSPKQNRGTPARQSSKAQGKTKEAR